MKRKFRAEGFGKIESKVASFPQTSLYFLFWTLQTSTRRTSNIAWILCFRPDSWTHSVLLPMDSFGWRYSPRYLGSRWTKTKLSFPKSAQEIHTMQQKNRLSGVNLSWFKTSPDFIKVESANVHFHANPFTSLGAQCSYRATWAICIFTKAQCVSLGVLWLDFKVDNKKISFLTLSSLYPKTKFRTVLMYFQVLFCFIITFSS